MLPRKILEATVVVVSSLVLTGTVAVLIGYAGSSAQSDLSVPPIPGGIPAAKARLLEGDRQAIIDARAKTTGPKPSAHTPPPQEAPQVQAGIVNMHQGPFPASEFIVSNFWQGPIDSSWILVYAGATRNPDGSVGTAVLRLYRESPNAAGGLTLSLIGTFVEPRPEVLTILSVAESDMQLQSNGGRIIHFNLLTHQFR